jgi:hypothetical protein
MSNGTQNDRRIVYQELRCYSACIAEVQLVPAGLLLPVPAHPSRSSSTRSRAMNLFRSAGLHTAQKPTFPALMNSPGKQ